jgi:hypothetical protein
MFSVVIYLTDVKFSRTFSQFVSVSSSSSSSSSSSALQLIESGGLLQKFLPFFAITRLLPTNSLLPAFLYHFPHHPSTWRAVFPLFLVLPVANTSVS